MANDLGYGELSCYGSKTIHSPNIDSLAAQGIRFTDYHANGSVCTPTRAELMSGKYQQCTGVEGGNHCGRSSESWFKLRREHACRIMNINFGGAIF